MLNLLEDRKSGRFAVLVGGVWLGFSLGYLLGLPGENSRTWIANIGTLLGAWSVVGLAFLLWRAYERGEVARRIWTFLLAGFLLWAIGDAIWAYFDLQPGGEVPYPSLADLAWVAGYPLLWIALWLRYRSMEVQPGRGPWIALGAIALLGVLTFGLVLWPVLTYAGYDRRIEQVLDVVYPAGGFVLLATSVLVAASVRGGSLASPWRIVAAGIAVMSLSDLVFSYATWHEVYIVEGPPNLITVLADVPYMAAYATIAIGEFVQGRLDRTF